MSFVSSFVPTDRVSLVIPAFGYTRPLATAVRYVASVWHFANALCLVISSLINSPITLEKFLSRILQILLHDTISCSSKVMCLCTFAMFDIIIMCTNIHIIIISNNKDAIFFKFVQNKIE